MQIVELLLKFLTCSTVKTPGPSQAAAELGLKGGLSQSV